MNQPQQLIYVYDAFVSYNSKDNDVVEDIARRLEDVEGLTVWKDNWELTGGDDWLEALPQAIARSRGIVAFVGANGLGPWHREEIKLALMRAIEEKTVRLIPAALPGAPASIELPAFARSRHIVDMRTIDRWSLHLLRCAICGGRPGRRDQFNNSTQFESKRARLHVSDWSIENTGFGYIVRLRVANIGERDTIVLKSFLVRTHQVANHPITSYLPRYLAPIGVTKADKQLYVPRKKMAVWQNLKQDRYLVPGEVEDVEAEIDVPIGIRCVVSFGLHWHTSDEPLHRLSETGFAAIGQRGGLGIPDERDTYTPGQHNMDRPRRLFSPHWPDGWPQKVTLEDWEYYGAGEEKEHIASDN